jgi:hypothetical protein
MEEHRQSAPFLRAGALNHTLQRRAFRHIRPVKMISGLILISLIIVTACSSDRDEEVVQWHRWHHTFELPGAPTGKRPVMKVVFTGPSGESFETHSFIEGNLIHVNAAFPAAGTWHWRTVCNESGYEDLQGRTGKVLVRPYSGSNPLYAHGDLRISADKRYLIHADGTPFLWMGDTGWNATVRLSMQEWREYVDKRAAQQFSILQIGARGAGNKFTEPASESVSFNKQGLPDPSFWHDLEDKIHYANEKGLMIFLVGVGKSWHDQFAENKDNEEFELYLTGRLSGDMVIFSPSFDQLYDPGNDSVAVRLDRYTTHLVTQHPGTNYEANLVYRNASSTAFCGLQSGHHRGDLAKAYHAARSWTTDMWNGVPAKPVIEIEAMYDALGGNEGKNWREKDARKLGWIAWLSGARGYTYGAGDVPPKVPGASGGVWRFDSDSSAYDYWRKAIMWPSAGQMTTMRNFFESIEWWRLTPAQTIIQNQPEDETLKMVASTTGNNGLVLAYLPDNPVIQLNLENFEGTLRGKWLNPETGNYIALDESVPAGSDVEVSRPEGWEDALLILTKDNAP